MKDFVRTDDTYSNMKQQEIHACHVGHLFTLSTLILRVHLHLPVYFSSCCSLHILVLHLLIAAALYVRNIRHFEQFSASKLDIMFFHNFMLLKYVK